MPTALDHYLAFGYVPGAAAPCCRASGSCRRGTCVTFDLSTGAASERAYWTLPGAVPPDDADADRALCDESRALMLDSVRLRLTRGDVPVGILLSGGVDSSLVTAMAARASVTPVHTFNDHVSRARRLRRSATRAAGGGALRHTAHRAAQPSPRPSTSCRSWPGIYDEPIADSSMVPTYLVSRLIRREATVALGGDGGDELFGGYPHYQWLAWQQSLRRWLPGPFRAGLASVAPRMPLGARARNHLIGISGDASWAVAHVNVYFDHATRDRLLTPAIARTRSGRTGPEALKAGQCGPGSILQQGTRVDFLTYLPDDLLVKVDRASMATSLEVRCPFLDHDVIAFAFGEVPDRYKAAGRRRKILLQMLATRLLPPAFDTSRKQGFSLPLHDWFAGSWGAFLRDVLLGSESGWFDRRVVEELLAGQAQGRANMQRLYALAFFELWRHEYRDRGGTLTRARVVRYGRCAV